MPHPLQQVPDCPRTLIKLLRDAACRSRAAEALSALTIDHAVNCKEVSSQPQCIEQLLRLLRVRAGGSYLASKTHTSMLLVRR